MGLLTKGSQSDTWPHFVPGGEEYQFAHYLLQDTSSGQMNSEQSLVAGTRSHEKISYHM
jgi:hypothetical protein